MVKTRESHGALVEVFLSSGPDAQTKGTMVGEAMSAIEWKSTLAIGHCERL